MLQVKLFVCGYAQYDPKCESLEKIKKVLDYQTVTFFIVNNYVDTINHTMPYVHGLTEKFNFISTKETVSSTQYISHLEVKSDDGLLFTNNNVQSSYSLDEIIDITSNGFPPDDRFLT